MTFTADVPSGVYYVASARSTIAGTPIRPRICGRRTGHRPAPLELTKAETGMTVTSRGRRRRLAANAGGYDRGRQRSRHVRPGDDPGGRMRPASRPRRRRAPISSVSGPSIRAGRACRRTKSSCRSKADRDRDRRIRRSGTGAEVRRRGRRLLPSAFSCLLLPTVRSVYVVLEKHRAGARVETVGARVERQPRDLREASAGCRCRESPG